MLLCRYKDVFGVPGQGAHSIRVFGLAAVDVVGTAGIAWLVHWWLGAPLHWALLGTCAAGVLAHWLFCVDTVVARALAFA